MGIFSNVLLSKQDEETAEILKNINIFTGLTPYERTKIAKFFRQQSYDPKARIMKEGDAGDRMYVIKSGAVKISKQITDKEEQVLANLVDGDFFGEMALLDNSPRSASVYAVSKVVMLELYRASLQELLNKEPAIGVKVLYNLAKILSERIRRSGDKIRDILIWQAIKKT
ncbi:MAG: cyclic nucleotide-binding domain-containing protein [bacterium]|nr:cyclic nucleotide-binding domain-containing protein [bacterium]